MFTQAYKAAFKAFGRKPFAVFGYAILSALISFLTIFFTFAASVSSSYYSSDSITAIFAAIPVAMALNFVIQTGMSKVYLTELEGKTPDTETFLFGFQKAKRVIGAMFWQTLWIAVWFIVAFGALTIIGLLFGGIAEMVKYSVSLVIDPWDFNALHGLRTACDVIHYIGVGLGIIAFIPLFGVACIKTYSYSFVPYILATKPDITVAQSLKLSVEMARGKKLHMFLADLLYVLAITLTVILLVVICLIPFANILLYIVSFVAYLALLVVAPVFFGFYRAEFFRLKPMPKAPKAPRAPKVPNYNGGYGAPQQGYGAPQQNYGAPQQNYGAPQQGYGAPQQGYGAPQQNYGAPQQNFNQNNQ